MDASAKIYSMLESIEQLRLKPYRDQGGRYTNGYGHLMGPNELLVDWTPKQAWDVLVDDVDIIVAQANKALGATKLSQNQFDAIILFGFNVGGHEMAMSTLIKKVLAGDLAGAADEFLRWDHVRIEGKLTISNGLKKRCELERELFLTPDVLHA